MDYDVFISCKSEDYHDAEEIYDFLNQNGIHAFLASKELRKLGDSEYRRAITSALKSAYHMVVFASKAEHIESEWVLYEWDMFVNAKLKGFKQGNILTILKGVKVEDIAMDLWKYQSFTFEDYKENILPYVIRLDSGGNRDESVRKFEVKGVAFEMVRVEGGTFMMGANEGDTEAYDWEKPRHQVTLSSYWIGRTEVTQALWKAVMRGNPSRFKGDTLPVECVSWKNCQTFIGKLNKWTGARFCLPTEAEWEYAARGGRQSRGYKYSGSNAIDEVAWYDVNSGDKTHPVGKKKANELGLYDMTGNVYEWCEDCYSDYPSSAQMSPMGLSKDEYRMVRGGGWQADAGFCRVSFRGSPTPGDLGGNLGLRLSIRE